MAKKRRQPATPADQPPPPAVEKAKPAPKAKAQPSWKAGLDFMVMLAGAVLIALVIKAYVFDVYLIPSGSMETALHGRPDGGDRIFCSKLSYRFRDLKRWEVAVFEFPYESARRYDDRSAEEYRGQNFVKRVVGLPGETLAVGKGDVWVRRDGSAEYVRQVKPDSAQRGMWLNVYEEDFSDIGFAELEGSWNIFGDGASLAKGGPLRLAPGSDAIRMDYRPMAPVGPERRLVELPGIPDRYTLRQPVQFKCANPTTDGSPCGHVFVKTIQTHAVQARCPRCGSLERESSAIFYHRRSGLPIYGRYAVPNAVAPQGENVKPRETDYHIVPDLRVVLDAVLADASSRLAVTLREDYRFVQAVVGGDGRVEILVNGEPSTAERRAIADIRPGRSHRLEFYIVEGTARVFIDGTDKPVLEASVWNDKRPFPRSAVRSSGVGLGATGGDCLLTRIAIDRDIFYYSGSDTEPTMMSANGGEIRINPESFFTMGDHCPSSYDARSWGPVPLPLLRGPALAVWWPPDRIHRIPSP